MPLVLRMTVYRHRFKPGPFNLGPFSFAVNVIAILWVSFACALFVLPQARGEGREGEGGGSRRW